MDAIESSYRVDRPRPMAFWRIFVSPLRTLSSLSERPRWFIPLVVAALFNAAIDYYASSRVGFESLVKAAAKSTGSLDPDGMLQNALAHKPEILAIQSIGSFLGVFATAGILALILWLLVLGLGGVVGFKRVMAVIAHVSLLCVVVRQSMLALTVTLNQDPTNFDLRNPLATNIGYFVHSSSPIMARVLSSLDLITLIAEILVIVGLIRVSRGLSRATASAIVFIPWGLYVAFRAWMSAGQ